MEWMLLPFKRYAEFSGRSRRKEYWMFALFNFLVFMALGVLAYATARQGSTTEFEPSGLVMGLFVVFILATIIPSLAVQVRRFHDQNKSGWFVLLNLIPTLGSLIVFIFMLMDGAPGANQYGPDPKGRAA